MKRFDDPFAIRLDGASLKENSFGGNRRFAEVSGSFLVAGGHSLWLGRLVSAQKSRLFLLFLLLVFAFLLGRLYFLQFYRGSYFRSLAEGNRLRLERLLPSRGIVFDRYGTPLVANLPSFTLFFESSQLKAKPELKPAAAEVLRQLSFG